LAFDLIDRGHKVMAGLEVASVRGIIDISLNHDNH